MLRRPRRFLSDLSDSAALLRECLPTGRGGAGPDPSIVEAAAALGADFELYSDGTATEGALEDEALLSAVRAFVPVEISRGSAPPSCRRRRGGSLVSIPPADRFSSSPDLSAEDSWRQTLLHEAVHAAGDLEDGEDSGKILRRATRSCLRLILAPAFLLQICALAGILSASAEGAGPEDSSWTLWCAPAALGWGLLWLSRLAIAPARAHEEAVAELCSVLLSRALGFLPESRTPPACAVYLSLHLDPLLHRRSGFASGVGEEACRRGAVLAEAADLRDASGRVLDAEALRRLAAEGIERRAWPSWDGGGKPVAGAAFRT